MVDLAALRARGGLASAARRRPDQISWSDAARHPLAASFAASQVVIVAISFAQI